MAVYEWEHRIRRVSVGLSATVHGVAVAAAVFGLPQLLDASVRLEIPVRVAVVIPDVAVGFLPSDPQRNLRSKESPSPADEGLPPLSGDDDAVLGDARARAGAPVIVAQTADSGGTSLSDAEPPSAEAAGGQAGPSNRLADWMPERPNSLAELDGILRRRLNEMRKRIDNGSLPPAALAKTLKTAAEQGDPEAQYKLAVQYELGLGVPNDPGRSIAWYRKAADKRVVDAQVRLGYLLATGDGAAQALVEAQAWWSVAADTGDPLAVAGRDLLARELTPRELSEADRHADKIRRAWDTWQRWAAADAEFSLDERLLAAARAGAVDEIKRLIEFGADPNVTDAAGRSALLLGAIDGRHDAVETLLRRGARVNTTDGEGRTALMWASEEGHETVAKILLRRGADINARDKHGKTALIDAAWRGRAAIIEALLALDADPNVKATDGTTALLWAAINGYAEVARLLIGSDANVDTADRAGVTPLMRAVWNRHTETVTALIARGADVNARSKEGHTALRLARQNRYREIIALLREAGARR